MDNRTLCNGEPLCGWQWLRQHQHDLDGWTPRIEIIRPGFRVSMTIKDDKAMKEVVKIMREERRQRSGGEHD